MLRPDQVAVLERLMAAGCMEVKFLAAGAGVSRWTAAKRKREWLEGRC